MPGPPGATPDNDLHEIVCVARVNTSRDTPDRGGRREASGSRADHLTEEVETSRWDYE